MTFNIDGGGFATGSERVVYVVFERLLLLLGGQRCDVVEGALDGGGHGGRSGQMVASGLESVLVGDVGDGVGLTIVSGVGVATLGDLGLSVLGIVALDGLAVAGLVGGDSVGGFVAATQK